MADEEDPVNVYMRLGSWPEIPNENGAGVGGNNNNLIDFPFGEIGEIQVLGFIIANIVSYHQHSGTITGREMVTLVREPLNRYDRNAIQVFNIEDIQVGYVERSVSAVLGPLLDKNLICIEGIVPFNQGRRGNVNRYKIPFQIHVFTNAHHYDAVNLAIARGGLQLIKSDDDCVNISELVRQNEEEEGKRLNDIFKVVDVVGPMEVMEAPKEAIKSELFLHQKEALAWLVRRENSDELPPFWVERSGGVFVNEIMGFETNDRPQPLHGGIFADDMGLGKTFTLLCLIALDKFSPGTNTSVDNGGSDEGEEFVVYGGKYPKKGKATTIVSNIKKRQKIGNNLKDDGLGSNSIGAVALRTTLVVCPPAVFSTWIAQLEEHTRPGKLNVYMYYGDRTDDPMELIKYDLVLTTYTTLGNEVASDSPVFKVDWWRVILDEAHMIKNANALQTQAVNKLNAKKRWVVTGTPIQNGTIDLFSLMAFLRYEPFASKSYWTTLVQRPVDNGDEFGLSRLQAVMSTISLRRTKDKGLPTLPKKVLEICYVDLSVEERELYDRMELEAKSVVRDYISANRVTSNYTTVLSIVLRLRQICTDVALCPPDLIASLPVSNIEDLSNNPELLKKMVAMLEDGEDFDCPICISTPTNIVITCCAHIFCKSCILKTLKRGKPCCPLCRHALSESDLFSPPSDLSDSTAVVSSSKSSKISALLKLLSASRDQDPTAKSVIFSQFRKMLILLEEPLKKAGFKILRLDGSINAKSRSRIIKEFGVPAPDGPTVLLASLKASGTGVNLAAASTVYLLEPWWNPAVEEQAMDRVHRIGQTKEVRVVRIIARNSIDERILELQGKKKRMALEAFNRKAGPTVGREINIDDIRTLISLILSELERVMLTSGR